DLDFAKLVGTMPKACLQNQGVVDLPKPDRSLIKGDIAELFERRQSIREYAEKAVPLTMLSTLLYFAAGVKGYLSAYGFERFPLRAAGIVMENFYLAANALGLGICGVGGGHDEQTAAVLGLDPVADREAPVASLLLGLPKM